MAVILGVVMAVMLVMNAMLFYVLRQAAAATRRQVKSNFVAEMEAYSGFLAKKRNESRRIGEEKDALQKEIESLEGVMLSLKTSPFYAPRQVARELFIPTARYIDDEFFDNHKRVTDMLRGMDYQKIVERIASTHMYQGNRDDYETANDLLSLFNMDVSYELCTMEPELQLKLTKRLTTGKGRAMLDRYLLSREEEGEEEFDVLSFRSFLREVRTAQDPTMYIRTGHRELYEMDIKGQTEMKHQYDENISEGLKIIYQNRSYDFSIYRLRSRK